MIEPLESRWLLAGDLVEWARLLPTADAADTQHSGDGFGVSVAIDGDTAVIGAYADGGERPLAGAAYVFTRNGSDWDLQQKLTASDAQLFDYFGYAVAIRGETILIGAMLHDDGGVSDSGAAYVFTRSAGVWTEQQKLVASDAGAEDRFGGFVAIDGNTAVVGAFGDDTAAGTDAGSAYVFVGSGGVWAEQQKLTAPDAAAGDSFGVGLGLDGDTLIVGAYQKDLPSNPDAGAAYVYTLSGGVWSHQQTLTSPTPAAGDGFGNSVALRGETAVVGAYADDTAAGINAGSGFVFTRSGSTWTAVQQISATDAAAGDLFGVSVRIDAGTIVVGAYQSDTAAGADAGAVYVFRESGGVWSQQQKLTASTAAAGDLLGLSAAVSGTTVLAGALRADTPFGTDSGAAYFFVDDGSAWTELQWVYQTDQDARGDTFGTAVAIDGTTLAVGASQDDVAGVNAGAAYVFTRTGTDWTLQQKLTAPGLQANDRFGWAIGVLGDTLVVAAPLHAVGPAAEAGAVFVFARTGDDWTYQQTLTASDAAANDWFGVSLALGDGTLIVGAESADTAAGANAGSAYVFVVDGSGVWSQQQKLTAADGAAGDQFGHAVALDGDTVVVGAFQHNLFGWNDAGSAYVFVRNGTTWTEQQKLTAPVPYSGALFGSAVAIRGDHVLVGAEGVDVGFVHRAGAAHLFTRSGTQWSHQQQLSATDPGSVDRFGSVVAIGSELLVIGANLRDSAFGSNVGSAFLFTSDGGTWSQQQELTGRDQYRSDQFGSAVAVSGPLVVVGAPLADLAGGNSGGVYVFAPDDTQSPTITGTAPSLAASNILDAGTRSLVVEFSEAVLGGGDAGNYQLQSVGPDGLLGTADDAMLPLSVTYSGTTATLVFPALPESVYRLTVRDLIMDLVGNPLDGDGNDLPGGDARLEFTVVPPVGGLFASSTEYLSAAYAFPQAIAAADFNGDGVVDLVTVNSTGNVVLFLADGAGGISLAGTFPTGGAAPWSVAVGDFNGDGYADLAVANTNSSNVGILLGNGAGGFAPAVTYATGGTSPWYLTVGDFNGDGNDDLAVANTSSNSVGILLGDGVGGFAPAVSFATGGTSPRSVAVGDFNGDGKDDLAVANSASNTVGILLGDGAGGFGAAVTYGSGGTSPRTVITGDFNGDGKLDVAVTNIGNRRVGILSGDGVGGLGTADFYDTVGASPEGIVSGDFNGDGRADLAIGTNTGVAVLLGNDLGKFNTPAVVHTTGGSQAKYVAVGDFNQDGKLDIAAAHVGSHNVGVVLGNGDGGFDAAVAYAPGGATPEAIASGDFNGDGIADLVTVNKDSGNVGVLLGDGAGGFAAALTYPTGGQLPRSVAVGDFNGDGIPDLAVANYSSANVGILLGNGVGGFAPAVTYPAGSSPTYVAVGDFNGDGHADLAVTRQGDHRVAILLGDGTGGFSSVGIHPTGGTTPVGVAVGDFDGNGKLDLAVVNSIGNNVGILLGDGFGGFSSATAFTTGGSSPISVAVGDFNGDGRMDLAIVNTTTVGVLLGNGLGGFGTAIAYGTGGFTPKSVVVGDFNADGDLDLAVANSGSSGVGRNVGILLGNGSGGFAPAVPHVIGGSTPSSLIRNDFNADGYHDLAVANATSHNVSILLGRGAGGLGAAITYGTGGANPSSVAVDDFNNDGKSDLVVVNSVSSNVGVLLGDGSGGFGAALTYGVGSSSPNAVAVGDFNLDGKADVAYVRNATNNVGILLGDGAGGFTTNVLYSIGGTNPRSIAVGDFNGDGKADLAVANQGSHNISILLNNGSGGFPAPVTFGTGGTLPTAVAVGDFDGDGRADLAVTNSGTDTVGILFGDGTGGFSPAVAYPTVTTSPRSVVVGDLNGDGWDDLAIIGSEVSVLLGDGSGGFAPAVTYASGGSTAYQVSVGDFNADGKPDLAVVHYASSNVGVLLGNGAGGFAAATTYASGGVSASALTVGDFNADGKDDLAATNYGSGNVGIFLNTGQYRPGVRDLISPYSMRFAVQTRGFGAGQLVEGTGGAFDGMGRLEVAGQTYAPTQAADFLADGGRTVVTPTVVIAGLYVSRKITVPDSDTADFARTVDVLTNPGSQPITTTVRIVGNLGSDAATTVWKTSSGDTIVEPTDQWIGTDDADGSGTPAIVHYLHGPSGLVPTAASIRGDLGDNIEWTYQITVPAGETVRLAHFTILAETRAAAETAAAALVTPDGFGGQAAAYLSEDELASLANFQFDSSLASLSAVLDGEGNLIVVDVDATGKDNQLTVRLSGADLVISDTGERFASAPVGGVLSNNDRTLTIPLTSVTSSLVIDLGGGNDVLTVDFAGGSPIPTGGLSYDGGAGDDLLRVLGSGTQDVTYTPSSATFGDGAVAVDGRTIAFAGLEPTDYVNVGTFTLSLPNANDVVQIAAGTLAGDAASDALVFTGTTGGVAFESAHVRNTASVVLDTTATNGDDTITISGAANGHGNTNLTILTGTGANTVNITGNIALATDGTLTIETRTINVAAGAGIAVTGDVTLSADSMDLASTASIDAGNNAVTLRPLTPGTLIDLGGADVLSGSPRTLGLTDAELDRITAGTLTIGDAASGAITVSAAITRPSATDVHLISGGGIVFDPGSIDTAGGDLNLAPGTEVRPLTAGTDATVDTVSFAAGAKLAIRIDGTTVATEYSQLSVAGAVDLTGAVLALSGSHTPAIGEQFTIVNSLGSAPVIGTFAGLPEGAVISNFLGSGRTAVITYQGGDGNDVVLTVDYLVEVRLVALQAASGTDTLVTLPDSVMQLDAGDDFFLEVWVQDMHHKVGVQGGYVTLTNPTQAAQAQALNHGGVFTILTSGTINNPQWRVESFGGGTLGGGQGAKPNWARLGYVRYEATAGGEILFESAPGDLQFSLSGMGNVSPQNINFGSVSLTSVPQLSITGVTQAEGDAGTTDLEFLVTLSHPSNQQVTVAYTTQDGTATVGDFDYQFTAGTLTFAPNQTQKTITVPVIGDLKVEDDETFSVILSNPTNATITQATATGTIENDDSATVSISPANRALPEGDSGLAPFEFTVSLSAPVSLPVTVLVNTVDGSATVADDDYQPLEDLLVTFIPGGSLEQTVTVNVVGDTKGELDETFQVILSDALWNGEADDRIALGTAQATGTIVNDDPLVGVQLVAVAAPSASGSTALPSPLDAVTLGSTYYVEVWVQDRLAPGVGISGGQVDLHYATAVVDGVAVVNLDFTSLPDGEIDDPNGVVRDLGGGSLSGGLGIAPGWARLGYVEMLATGLGEATFDLTAGSMEFGRFGEGNVPWDFVDFAAPVVVDQIGGTRIEMTIVREPSATDAKGERVALPASAEWVHEWQLFWVEIWVNTPETTTLGVAGASVDLHYNTDYLTAIEIQYGPAFTANLTGTIDDAQGLVSAMGGATAWSDVGDDGYVLLARVRFGSIGDDQVPVVAEDCFIGPYDMGIALADGQTELVGAGAAAPELGGSPGTELWAVMYDFDDNNLIDFGDLAFFAPAFAQLVGPPQPPHTCWADFDKSGQVDFGDLSFFAPNFAVSRAEVQSGAKTLVFPPNFPDAWRGDSGDGLALPQGGAGLLLEAEGEDDPLSWSDAPTAGALLNLAPAVSVQAVAVATPTAAGSIALPSSLAAVTLGRTYFVEVWVQDLLIPGKGISGGSVDVNYATALVDAVGLVNQDFALFPEGAIDEANGAVRNLGGGTLLGGLGIAPQWVRLGYVEVLATEPGEAAFELSAGSFQFSRYGVGNVDWGLVDLGSSIVVAQISHPWQNPVYRWDINDDGMVTPLDVLIAINELNQNGSRELPVLPQPPLAPPPYYDVSGDDWLTPLDALLVINYINEHGPGPIPVAPSAASPIIPASLADGVWAEAESFSDPVPRSDAGHTPQWLDPWPATAEADSPVSGHDTRPHRRSARWEPFDDLLTLLAERLPDGRPHGGD